MENRTINDAIKAIEKSKTTTSLKVRELTKLYFNSSDLSKRETSLILLAIEGLTTKSLLEDQTPEQQLVAIQHSLRRLRLQVSLIDLRIDENERQHAEHLARGNWSQISGNHGIGTGLWMAKTLLLDSIKELERSEKALQN